MENEKMSTADKEDILAAFAGAFERSMKNASSDETFAQQNDSAFMSVGNRMQAAAFAPQPITDEEPEEVFDSIESDAAPQQPEEQADEPVIAGETKLADETEQKTAEETQEAEKEENNDAAQEEPVREPTEKELRKAAIQEQKMQVKAEKAAVRQQRRDVKTAKKDAKWEKKDAKRKAQVERQQRNNTRIMLGGAIFLGIICAALLLMNHFDLSFMDIPDVLSGEKSLTGETTTMALAIVEQTESGPIAPPKGNYVVSAEDGVYMREGASTSSSRILVLSEGIKVTVSAFKYDPEKECFWGRTGYNGNYGWVMMTALSRDETPTEPATEAPTTAESLG